MASLARSRSSVSSNACRSRFFVPSASIDAARPPRGDMPLSDVSSPWWQADLQLHRLAAGLLRQERDFHAVRQRKPLRARLEVGWRRLERFAGGHAGVALVVLDHRRDVDRGRRRRAIGLRIRNELARRAVRGLQVFERHALHVGGVSLRH